MERTKEDLFHTLDCLQRLVLNYEDLAPIVIAHEVTNFWYKGLASDYDPATLVPGIVEWQQSKKN
jgi:hypothetical protein